MRKIFGSALLLILLSATKISAQSKIYETNNMEFLFQNGQISKNGINLDQNVRFTLWFNYTHQIHYDFTNNIGLYSGLGVRNTGFITKNEAIAFDGTLMDKIKRRVYTVGIPLALKIGSFKDNFYIYGGGELELAVAYKEKRWDNGQKFSKSSLFGQETNLFLPSAFIGIQFPHGMNLQYKCYLADLLRTDYGKNTKWDQAGFDKSIMQYISLSFNLGAKDWKKYGFEFHKNEVKSL